MLEECAGEERYLEGIVTIEHDSQGDSVGVRGVVRDVTARRVAEIALQKQTKSIVSCSNPIPVRCMSSTSALLPFSPSTNQQ